MKNKFLFAVAAAAVAMTSCQTSDVDEAMTDAVSAEKFPFSLSINLPNEAQTRAVNSGVGGWTNYQNNNSGLLKKLDHRLTVQVFAQGKSAPVATAVNVIKTDGSEAPSNELSISDIRLSAGQNYTAVVWVDFVAEGKDADLWYNTANLSQISVISDANLVNTDDYTQESRDAYSAKLDFSVDADGLWTVKDDSVELDPGQPSSVAIPLTATRPFSKLRVVLKDFDTLSEWESYVANAARTMNYAAITVEGTPTEYNALTQTASADNKKTADLIYNGAWTTKSIKYVNADYKSLTYSLIQPSDTVYAVIDMNYVFPTAAMTNAVTIQTLDLNDNDFTLELADDKVTDVNADGYSATAAEVISYRTFPTIPLKTNELTTIAGNFITNGYNFSVKVDDDFSDNVNYVEYEDVAGAAISVEKDSAGNITSVTTDEPIPAKNAQSVIDEIADLELAADSKVTLEFADVVANDKLTLNLAELGVDEVTIIVPTSDPASFNSDHFVVISAGDSDVIVKPQDAVSTKAASAVSPGVSVATTGNVTFEAGNYYALFVAKAADVTVNEGVSTLNKFSVNNEISGNFNATSMTVGGDAQILAAGEIWLTSSTVTGDANLEADAKITLTSSTVNGNLVATSAKDGINPAIRIDASNVLGTSTLTGTVKNVLVENGSVLTGDVYIDSKAIVNINTKSVIEGKCYLSSRKLINLIDATFNSSVYASQDKGVLISENTNDIALNIDGCTFKSNVLSYLNSSFADSALATGMTFKLGLGTDGDEELTLTVTGAKNTGFLGKFTAYGTGKHILNFDDNCTGANGDYSAQDYEANKFATVNTSIIK